MKTQHGILKVLSVCLVSVLLCSLAMAQTPAQSTPLYTGNIGGGFAVTGGNTHTSNFNLTAALVRDPKTRNVIKGSAAYLRGLENERFCGFADEFFRRHDEHARG